MDAEQMPTEQQLLTHAKRQTELLSSINGALMFLLALAILGVLIGAAFAFDQ